MALTAVIVLTGGPDAVDGARRRMTPTRGGIVCGLIFACVAIANLAIAIAPLSLGRLRWDYVFEWCALIAVVGVLTAVAAGGWLARLERRGADG